MRSSWKRAAAGIMALSMVTGSVPFEPISQAVTSWTALVASADNDESTTSETISLTSNSNVGDKATISGNFGSISQASGVKINEGYDNRITISVTDPSVKIKRIEFNAIWAYGYITPSNIRIYSGNGTVSSDTSASNRKIVIEDITSECVITADNVESGSIIVNSAVITYEEVSTKTTLTAENTTVTMATNSADVASVVVGETTLSATTDYTVSYKQGDTPLEDPPAEPGTYTAVITGQGNYEGEVQQTFTLEPYEAFDTFSTTNKKTTQTYSGTICTVVGFMFDEDGLRVGKLGDKEVVVRVASGYTITRVEYTIGYKRDGIDNIDSFDISNGKLSCDNFAAGGIIVADDIEYDVDELVLYDDMETITQIKNVKVYYEKIDQDAQYDLSDAVVELNENNMVSSVTLEGIGKINLSKLNITYGTDDDHTFTAAPDEPGKCHAYVTGKDSQTRYTGMAVSDEFEIHKVTLEGGRHSTKTGDY
ncbi:hypothetical protein SAMN02910447_03375 [Ruminococcus sp. YE71]|uniref:hypothetical protein n=1 Tax=unclassified Ruminococcus TaxID=2608920 RepID=UPI000888B0C1|nr:MULTISPECIES: hypothetical protein [unclassified Ruminococcus]SDA31183.1 hypothetical protein SAMN02910446_03413 [Ruminococcus sp. YE78]SFW51421.1 hypothetical protein SAMN02910447_03375 [Ruminococcus sp. YE71]